MKKTLLLFLITLITPWANAYSSEIVYMEIHGPISRKIPIAVQDFIYIGSEKLGADKKELILRSEKLFLNTVKRDLKFTQLFDIIEKDAFLVDAAKDNLKKEDTDFLSWRLIGTELLIKGGFYFQGEKIVLEARLFDTIKEEELLGKRYRASFDKTENMTHRFMEEVMKKLTGTRGIFTTKLFFVSKKTGTKEIYFSDFDGKNISQVTRNQDINISPRWSKDGRTLLYTSYKNGKAAAYTVDLIKGREKLISNKPGINIGGDFSNDNKKILLTLNLRSNQDIYELNIETNKLKRITKNWAIDVSPSYSPDGKAIVFVSDRAGNPHIYMLDLAKDKAERLTFRGKYNTSPSFSPNGESIVFCMLHEGKFQIATLDLRTRDIKVLTNEGNNENPSYSPNGKYIMFNREDWQGRNSIFVVRASGHGAMKIIPDTKNSRDQYYSPNWSPFFN